MNWENDIRVTSIFNEFIFRNNIDSFTNDYDCSICNGWVGRALAISAMVRDEIIDRKCIDFDNLISLKYKQLAYFIENTFDISMVSGISGVLWALNEFRENSVTSYSKSQIDRLLYKAIIRLDMIVPNYISPSHYDYMNGLLGYARILFKHQVLLTQREEDIRKIKILLDSLLEYDEYNNYFIKDYSSTEERDLINQVNLTYAHGVPSIVKFYLDYDNWSNISQKNTIDKLVGFLYKHMKFNLQHSCIPINLIKDKLIWTERQAWCMGDLPIIILFYLLHEKYELASLNKDIIKKALEYNINRHDSNIEIPDHSICHGISSIAYSYLKINKLSQVKVISKIAEKWFENLISSIELANNHVLSMNWRNK